MFRTQGTVTRLEARRLGNAVRATFGGAVALALGAALVAPAYAGHGAAKYENPLRSAQEKRREKEAEARPAQPAAVVPSPAPAVAPPASPSGTSSSIVQGAKDADHAYALTVRRQLADVAASAESQIGTGTDGKLRALAERALQNARKEIAEIDRWLAAHP